MKKTQKHRNLLSSSLPHFLPEPQIVILHNFSLECMSEKLAVLNFGELFRLLDLDLSRANLAFRSVVSSKIQLFPLSSQQPLHQLVQHSES